MNKKWSIEEENFLKENVGILTDAKLANKLTELTGRAVSMLSVRKKRQKLGLKKAQGRGVCSLTDEVFQQELENFNS